MKCKKCSETIPVSVSDSQWFDDETPLCDPCFDKEPSGPCGETSISELRFGDDSSY